MVRAQEREHKSPIRKYRTFLCFNFLLPLFLINKAYFCSMLTRKFLTFSKIFTLLLLISGSMAAKSVRTVNEFQQQPKESLNKTESGLHTNMLQPHVIHVNAIPEHLLKQVHSGFGILFFSDTNLLLLQPLLPTKVILQDVNRCESVSQLLFPYHFFW